MPHNLESDFRKAARKLKQKNRRVLLQKIGVVVLSLAIVTGVVYTISKSSLSFDSIVLLSIIGLCFALFSIDYFIKVNSSIFSWKSLQIECVKFARLKPFPSFVIIIVLLFCLQFGQSLLIEPLNDLVTYWRYAPTPPLAAVPWAGKYHQTVHRVIAELTPELERSIESVAKYIDRHEPDPYLKIKALHDYVISRVIYDLDVIKTGLRTPQDAASVFRSHKAVCEGYSRLFTALGQAIGIDTVYIEGRIRKDLVPLDLIPKPFRAMNFGYDYTLHAWNAVKVAGNWQLVDTTWDGSSPNRPFVYQNNYLMPPPEVMIVSHLPDRSAWQLLAHAIDRVSFEDLPILEPKFFTDKLQITSPVKYRTQVRKIASIEIKKSPGYQGKITAVFSKDGEDLQDQTICQNQPSNGETTQISCQFPSKGDYIVSLFKNEGIYLGQLKFKSTSD